MRTRPLFAGGAVVFAVLLASFGLPTATAAQDDMTAATAALEWREIGPTIMGGRVADLAVDEANPSTFYVGTATGGLWKEDDQRWPDVRVHLR